MQYPVDRSTDPKSHFLDHFVGKIVGWWSGWSRKHGGIPFLDTLNSFSTVPAQMESPLRTERAKTWNFGRFANFSKSGAEACRPNFGLHVGLHVGLHARQKQMAAMFDWQ